MKSCSLAIANRWKWKAAGGDVLIVGSLETKMKSKISATRLAPKLDKVNCYVTLINFRQVPLRCLLLIKLLVCASAG